MPAQDSLIYLDIVAGTVNSINPDGSNDHVLVHDAGHQPDGVQIDVSRKKIYWTAMGVATENDGMLYVSNVDGSEVNVLVQAGGTHTPKQLYLDNAGQKLYWCDREGGRIQSCDVDGSHVSTLYDSAPGKPRPLRDGTDWCVGIVLDEKRELIYWTQKGTSKGGQGRIFRKRLDVDDARVEVLLTGLPEPIDLELDEAGQDLYWTDRGDLPNGNTLNYSSISHPFTPPPNNQPRSFSPSLILADHFHEAIGLSADWSNKKMYVADALGSLWVVDLGKKRGEEGAREAIVRDVGNYTGVVFVKGG